MTIFLGLIALAEDLKFLDMFRQNDFAAKNIFLAIFIVGCGVSGLAFIGTLGHERQRNTYYVSEFQKWQCLDDNSKSQVARYGWVLLVLLTIGCFYLSGQANLKDEVFKGVLKAILPMMIVACSLSFALWGLNNIGEYIKTNGRDAFGEIRRADDLQAVYTIFSWRTLQRYNTLIFVVLMCCAYLTYLAATGVEASAFHTAGYIALGVTGFASFCYVSISIGTEEISNRCEAYKANYYQKDKNRIESGYVDKTGLEVQIDNNDARVQKGAMATYYLENHTLNKEKLVNVFGKENEKFKTILNLIEFTKLHRKGDLAGCNNMLSENNPFRKKAVPQQEVAAPQNGAAGGDSVGAGANRRRRRLPTLERIMTEIQTSH